MAVLDIQKNRWIETQLEDFFCDYVRSVICLNEDLYLIGAYGLESLRRLDEDFQWEEMAPMHTGRIAIQNSTVIMNGCLWVLGGNDPSVKEFTDSVEKYDPEKNEWNEMRYVYSLGYIPFLLSKMLVCF